MPVISSCLYSIMSSEKLCAVDRAILLYIAMRGGGLYRHVQIHSVNLMSYVDITYPTLAKHLNALEERGLISVYRYGGNMVNEYMVNTHGLN